MNNVNLKINLPNISDVKTFVSIANKVNYELDIISGKYVVDAKSIMGLFSLDLSNPLNLTVYSSDCKDFLEEIAQFIVE